jgi:hypothetical protein
MILDNSGNPVNFYHGSDAKFNNFDYKFIGRNGRMLGAGFYFTTDKNTAKGYGKYLYTCNLDIKKPCSYNNKKPTKLQLIKLLTNIMNEESKEHEIDLFDTTIGSTYDSRTIGINSTLQQTSDLILKSSESLIDVQGDLIGMGNSVEHVNKSINKIFGYDSFVSNGYENAGKGGGIIYTVLLPNLIEIKSVESSLVESIRNMEDNRLKEVVKNAYSICFN